MVCSPNHNHLDHTNYQQHGIKKQRITEQVRIAKAQRDEAKITWYRNLTASVLKLKNSNVFTAEALLQTRNLLTANPEFNAIWNYRRDILLCLIQKDPTTAIDLLGNDLQMVTVMIQSNPKCYWIWNHRRWCLEELAHRPLDDWQMELRLVQKILNKDGRNFHGWHYRRYVVSSIEKENDKIGGQHANCINLGLYISEFQYTTTKIEKDISNFSAWHSRTKLIPKIIKQLTFTEFIDKLEDLPELGDIEQFHKMVSLFRSPLKLLDQELELVKTGIFMDSADTSVWLYMRWLLTDKVFTGALKNITKDANLELLQQQFNIVVELNDLEKEDSPKNEDNIECLKMLIFIKSLMNKFNNSQGLDKDTQHFLKLLINLDPLRAGHYKDQLQGLSPLSY